MAHQLALLSLLLNHLLRSILQVCTALHHQLEAIWMYRGVDGLNLPLLRPRFLAAGCFWRRRHRFDGQHYWEMGCRGYSRRRIRTAIAAAGLRIDREFRPPLSLFAYGFVLTRHAAVAPSLTDCTAAAALPIIP